MDPIYLDNMGHLWSPDRNALHGFAQGIGLRRHWFQDRTVLYHYDIMSAALHVRALRRGAIAITARELVKMMRDPDG